MSLPWPEIPFAGGNVDGDPVRGSVAEVESVVTMFDRMGTASENIHSTFETLKDEGGDSESLRGDAADQFREIVEAVSGTLGDLPRVAGEAHGILNDHLARLEDLRIEAASALVRANTRWEEVEGARSAVGSAESTNTRLQGQVNDLPPAGADPVADGDRPGVESAAQGALQALGIAQGNLEEAEADLAASKSEWGGLREDEDSLNSDTSGRLDDIGLGDLSDPSWWESLLGAAFDLLMDLSLLDELFALIEAIATGDWAAALWMLKDILDTVMLIVAVVALFTPLGPLVAVLALTYLAATATLYFTQWPNPETGETVSGLDLAFAVADVIPGGAAVSATRRAVRRGYSSAADAVTTAARRGGRAAPSPGAATPPSGSATPSPGAATPPSGSATPPSSGTSTNGAGADDIPTVTFSRTRYPESARPYDDLAPDGVVGPIDRAGAAARRNARLDGIETRPNMHRDEFPPAILDLPGRRVTHIPGPDNTGSGATIGNRLRRYPDGTVVRIRVVE